MLRFLPIVLLLLTVSCTYTRSQMLPDGTWFVESGGGLTITHERLSKEFDERAKILCPQGHDLISKQNTTREMGAPGVVGRFTCRGEKALTAPSH